MLGPTSGFRQQVFAFLFCMFWNVKTFSLPERKLFPILLWKKMAWPSSSLNPWCLIHAKFVINEAPELAQVLWFFSTCQLWPKLSQNDVNWIWFKTKKVHTPKTLTNAASALEYMAGPPAPEHRRLCQHSATVITNSLGVWHCCTEWKTNWLRDSPSVLVTTLCPG